MEEIPHPIQYINTNATEQQVRECFEGMEMPEYKVNGGVKWIMGCLKVINTIE